jgi:hypothetical protein
LLSFLQVILFICIIGLEVGSIGICITINSLANIGVDACFNPNSNLIELLPKIAVYIYAISTAVMIFLISDLFKKIKNKWLICFLIVLVRFCVLLFVMSGIFVLI